MPPPPPKTVNLLVALLCLLWGSTWVVISEGLKDLPPFTSAGVRFAIAGMLMIVVAMTMGRREGGRAPAPTLWITLGILNFAVSYGIVYWATTLLPSGLVAVLWGVFPMMMAAMGHFFLPGERLRWAQWLGFVAGRLVPHRELVDRGYRVGFSGHSGHEDRRRRGDDGRGLRRGL